MSFTANIPASGQTLGNSRPQILNNFASLRTTIANATQPNHIDVNNIGAGKHIFIQMPAQVPTAIANQPGNAEVGLIAQSILGATQLFFAHDNEQSGGLPVYRQMTAPVTVNTTPTAQVTADGTSGILGGIIVKWGQIPATAANPIVFSSPFPNNVFSVVVTPIVAGNGNQIRSAVYTVSNSQFNYTADAVTAFSYVAIGN